MSFVEKERCNLKGNFTHSLISVTLDTEWCIFCLIYLLYNVELFHELLKRWIVGTQLKESGILITLTTGIQVPPRKNRESKPRTA